MEGKLVKAMQFYHLARRGGAFLVSIIIVKLGLSQEEVGIFETWTYLLMLFSFFWVESLVKAYLSIYRDDPAWEGRSGQATMYLMYSLIALFLGGLFYVFKEAVLYGFTGVRTLQYTDILIVYLILLPSTMLIPFLYQVRNNLTGVIAIGMGVLIGQTMAVTLPLCLGFGLQGILVALVCYALILHMWGLVVFVFPVLFRTFWCSSLVRGVFRYGWPLVLYAVVQSLTVLVDAILVQWYFVEKSAFAIFRYGARELPIVPPLITGMANLVIPILASKWEEGLTFLKRESLKVMHWVFPVAILLALCSRWIFGWVYSIEFEPSASIFNIYLMLIISQMLFPQTLLVALRENRALLIVGVLEVLTNVVLSWILLQYWGMMGIAAATVFAFYLEKIILIAIVRHLTGLAFGDYTAHRWWIGYSLALSAAVFYAL